MSHLPLFIGTYTRSLGHCRDPQGEGIHHGLFDTVTGRLELRGVTRGIENCSFLTVADDGSTLHSVWEVSEWPVGLVSSYRVDGETLEFLGIRSSEGSSACYTSTDARYGYVANYGAGTVARFPRRSDGSFGEADLVGRLQGSGPDASRQESSHAHCAVPYPRGRFLAVADLGADAIVTFRADVESGRSELPATWPESCRVSAPAGSGPRHIAFHPRRPLALVVGELDNSMMSYDVSEESGRLSLRDHCLVAPEAPAGTVHAADLQIHPQLDIVYCSVRGADVVCTLAIGAEGTLQPLDSRSTTGRTPRNLTLSPDGRFLLIAHQDSDSVVVMEVDQVTGIPGRIIETVDVPRPVCLEFGRPGT